MHDREEQEAPVPSTEGATDERPTGPGGVDGPYPQPVQEIVDPTEPEPLADRKRTDIAGHRRPEGDEEI